jgi:hypothetical protein
MAGLAGRETREQVLPAGTTAENPEDAIQDFARISPGPTTAVGATWGLWNKRLNDQPLLVGQFFASCHALNRSTTSGYL